jgi:Rad3-related DNA helicase
MKANPIWYSLETMKTVIQGANRATRNEKDYSVTYMLDTNFRALWARSSKFLPKYFNESIVWGKQIKDFKK